MVPFRVRFTAKRIFSVAYYRKLARILANPLSFYLILARKLPPASSKKPLNLKLKDGMVIRVREFWTLFLFDEIFVDRCYEPPLLQRYESFTTILDIGGNIGLYTLRMKQIWPEAQIVAVEPHPENFQFLREHIEINHLANVQPVQGGISEECGCMNLYLSPRNIAGHSMYKKTDLPPISVPVFPLSQLLETSNVKGNNILLKIDCEGCELALISSLSRAISDRITFIIFEPERALYRLDDLLQKLESLGFENSTFSDLAVARKQT